MTILAVGPWRTNAELIVACRDLGYIAGRVLDPTYGLGRFWSLWTPAELIAHDLDPARSPLGRSIDFTALPWPDRTFGTVVLDGPYKLNGTSTGRGASALDDSYGVAAQSNRWQDVHQLIRDGITESVRVLDVGGHLLVKCQNQVCSGQIRWQTIEFSTHAESLGCRLVDMLHLLGHRPQPAGRRQVHARQNYSTMLVLRRLPSPMSRGTE